MSVAAPIVSDVMAIYFQTCPNCTRFELKKILIGDSTKDQIINAYLYSGTPNSVVYIGNFTTGNTIPRPLRIEPELPIPEIAIISILGSIAVILAVILIAVILKKPTSISVLPKEKFKVANKLNTPRENQPFNTTRTPPARHPGKARTSWRSHDVGSVHTSSAPQTIIYRI
jgi:hypothetical protein